MRRMGVSVGGLLFPNLFIRRFRGSSRKWNGGSAFFDDVEYSRDRHRVAGLQFLERDLKRHALNLVRTLIELTGKILSQSLLIAPDVTGDPWLRPTGSAKKADKLLIFLALSERRSTAPIFDRLNRLAEQIELDILAAKIVRHGKKNLRMWGTRVREEGAFQTFDPPPLWVMPALPIG